MLTTTQLNEKWKDVLDHPDLSKIRDKHRRNVTARLIENQVEFAKTFPGARMLNETAANNTTAGVQNYDPVLISMIRRSMPNLLAYDLCGVQPMTGPTGLIFAMRSRYISQAGSEALFDEADTDFAGTGTHSGANPVANWGAGTSRYAGTSANSSTGRGITTLTAETAIPAAMAFDISKVTVTATTRQLQASYTDELAKDMENIHGLNAEAELSNILSSEILAEINREVVRSINVIANRGCASGTTTTAGTFDLDTDSNGRWSVEKFKGLLFQVEREANQIARDTRRGKGNFILCSSDVASALSMAGVLDYAPALASQLNVDDTGNTFAGVLQGRIKVYIDPYFTSSSAGEQYITVGYKGALAYDAGLFYCPYVPLQMVRAVDPDTFQPKIAFKTRYGLVQNPFSHTTSTSNNSTLVINRNTYYRIFRVSNLM